MVPPVTTGNNDSRSGGAVSGVPATDGQIPLAGRSRAPRGAARARGSSGSDRLGFAVTRADIAAFAAAQVHDLRLIGAAPGISN